jgi:hypothetical protein
MRELWDADVSASDAAAHVENANEGAWNRAQEDRVPRGRYSRQEVEDITAAGRGHLLRID